MIVYSDEMILLSKTYSETTPESIEVGEFSDSGFCWNNELCDMDDFMSHVDSMNDLDSADWFSSEWYTICYKTGTDQQESLHLHINATSRMREIWEAARNNQIELIYVDDDDFVDTRNDGSPVDFQHMADFEKVQGNLAL